MNSAIDWICNLFLRFSYFKFVLFNEKWQKFQKKYHFITFYGGYIGNKYGYLKNFCYYVLLIAGWQWLYQFYSIDAPHGRWQSV